MKTTSDWDPKRFFGDGRDGAMVPLDAEMKWLESRDNSEAPFIGQYIKAQKRLVMKFQIKFKVLANLASRSIYIDPYVSEDTSIEDMMDLIDAINFRRVRFRQLLNDYFSVEEALERTNSLLQYTMLEIYETHKFRLDNLPPDAEGNGDESRAGPVLQKDSRSSARTYSNDQSEVNERWSRIYPPEPNPIVWRIMEDFDLAHAQLGTILNTTRERVSEHGVESTLVEFGMLILHHYQSFPGEPPLYQVQADSTNDFAQKLSASLGIDMTELDDLVIDALKRAHRHWLAVWNSMRNHKWMLAKRAAR